MLHEFEWLLAPVKKGVFFEEIWQKKPSILARDRAGYFNDLFSMKAVEHILEFCQPKPPSIRIVSAKTREKIELPYSPNGRINMDKVRSLFIEGHTVILNSVENYDSQVAMLARSIEREVSARVQVNAYLTPPGAQGFRPHYDTHDVLVAQIQGEKLWKIYDESSACPLQDMYDGDPDLRASTQPPDELLIHPGDLLYIPRGWIHEAQTQKTASLHLTISLHPPLCVDLLYAAIDNLISQHPEFRQALPVQSITQRPVTDALQQQFDRLLQICVENASLPDALDEIDNQMVFRGRSGGDGHLFEDGASLSGINIDTKLKRRAHIPCRLVGIDEQVGLRFLSGLIKGPLSLKPAMEYVMQSDGIFSVSDLPEIPDTHKTVFAASLVKDGLCTIEH